MTLLLGERPATTGPTTRPDPRVTPVLEIDLGAVARNTATLSARTHGALMAVVKADGLGHGASDVARAALASGASWLGVTSLAEARALRAAGLDAPLLSWLNPVEADYAAATAERVDLGIASLAQLDAVAAAGPGARLHLHLDTGLARDGACPREWAALCRAARLLECRGRAQVVGLMGHLGSGDDPADTANVEGRRRFRAGVRLAHAHGLRPAWRHLAATAATLHDPAAHHTMSRVGAGLVGIDPAGRARLHPALTLTAPVVAVRTVDAGTPVGYGATWVAPRPTTLALLPVGYADGLPRAASGRAEVWLRGRRFRLVGRISMDQVVVDTEGAQVLPGEVATVFGPGGPDRGGGSGDGGEGGDGGLSRGAPSTADWARWAGTIEHEIVTGLGPRPVRTTRAVGRAR